MPTNGFSSFVFSMPGWSQASYDRIHGLDFGRVVANIEATIQNVKEMGYQGRFMLSFHVYQFNAFDELAAARGGASAMTWSSIPIWPISTTTRR